MNFQKIKKLRQRYFGLTEKETQKHEEEKVRLFLSEEDDSDNKTKESLDYFRSLTATDSYKNNLFFNRLVDMKINELERKISTKVKLSSVLFGNKSLVK